MTRILNTAILAALIGLLIGCAAMQQNEGGYVESGDDNGSSYP